MSNHSEPYDGDEFAKYPERAGWPDLVATHGLVPFWLRCQSEVIDEKTMKKQEAILQSWLFFGHLHAILSPFGLYNAEDYVDIDADGMSWLHTRGIEDTLPVWHERVRDLGTIQREAFLANAQQNYTLAAETLMALNMTNYAMFDRMIRLSLLAICGLVEGMILGAIDGSLYCLTPNPCAQLDTGLRAMMLANGWCPSEVAKVENAETSALSARWYLAHMKKPGTSASHETCGEEQCRLLQLDQKTYKPRHIDPACTCELLSPSTEEVSACLDRDDIPVIQVLGETLQQTSLEVHSLGDLPDDTSYIAISHVWADGLGNPTETALPTCQIQRLRRLVAKVQEVRGIFDLGPASEQFLHKTKFFLWCDTLCCPIELAAKQKALSRMRDVYFKAAFVLVLDKELESCNFEDIGLLEAGCRFVNSRYMRRLWTYQEAGLATKLLVQFADGPVDILPIMHTTSRLYHESPRREQLYLHVAASLANLRMWMRAEVRTAWLKEAVTGIAYRGVSVNTDEPLCLATVLNLDSRTIAHAAPEQRQEVLWQIVARHERGVRANIIFNSLLRQQKPGLRWAPVSVLQPIKRQLDSVEEGYGEPGVLMKQGLRIRGAGWRISRPGLPGPMIEQFLSRDSGPRNLTLARHLDGTSYIVLQSPVQGLAQPDTNLLDLLEDRDKEWYIIINKGEHQFEWSRWTSQRKALLVSKEYSEYGLAYFRSRMLLQVDRDAPAYGIPRQVDFLWADAIRNSWTLTMYNMVASIGGMCDVALARFPTSLAGLLSKITTPALIWSGRALGRRILDTMRRTASDAPNMPAAAKLLDGVSSETVRNNVGGSIVSAVTGKYAQIEQTFDSSTDWVVD